MLTRLVNVEISINKD